MRITAAQDAELSSLGDMVGISELTAAVHDLLEVCLSAVPSCLSLRVTSPALGPGHAIQTDGVRAAYSASQASLRLDLLGGDPGPDGRLALVCMLVLAADAGAFVDFVGGADPIDRRGFRIVRRTVDKDLENVTWRAEQSGAQLEDVVLRARVINRALGVLTDRGHVPDVALTVLRRQAETEGRTILDQAWIVVESTALT